MVRIHPKTSAYNKKPWYDIVNEADYMRLKINTTL